MSFISGAQHDGTEFAADVRCRKHKTVEKSDRVVAPRGPEDVGDGTLMQEDSPDGFTRIVRPQSKIKGPLDSHLPEDVEDSRDSVPHSGIGGTIDFQGYRDLCHWGRASNRWFHNRFITGESVKPSILTSLKCLFFASQDMSIISAVFTRPTAPNFLEGVHPGIRPVRLSGSQIQMTINLGGSSSPAGGGRIFPRQRGV